MQNLKFVEGQPRWRVAVVSRFAQLMGALIHVEGIPFGSNRSWKKQNGGRMGEEASSSAGAAGADAKVTQEEEASMTDLSRRLRQEAKILPHEVYTYLSPMLVEAAAEIERLRAENTNYRAAMDSIRTIANASRDLEQNVNGGSK